MSQGSGLKSQGSGFMSQVAGFKSHCSGFKSQGSGSRIRSCQPDVKDPTVCVYHTGFRSQQQQRGTEFSGPRLGFWDELVFQALWLDMCPRQY